MTGTLVAFYIVLLCVASIVYTEEASRWPGFGGRLDVLTLVLAVIFWPVPLIVFLWIILRGAYARWRHPVPATPEELHDER